VKSKAIRNPAHSAFQRLLAKARAGNEDFNFLLLRYGLERLLYRLSLSRHGEKFILKGASLFLAWRGQSYRVTRDADFLSTGDPNPERLAVLFREVCTVRCDQEDGMTFPPDSVEAGIIKEGQAYEGVRVTLMGMLNQARIPLQIDIGFGDIVTPGPELLEYPTLLAGPSPKLRAYTRYTVAAEKCEAMVRLGLANSRLKDFYDLWFLSRWFDFDGRILASALRNTFSRRGTDLPQGIPAAFSPAFVDDPRKRQQWGAFMRKARIESPEGGFPALMAEVAAFLLPVFERLQQPEAPASTWTAGRGWSDFRGEP